MTELEQLIIAAQRIGGQKDVVQGGGGNISLKLAPDTMLIKPSGFTFSELTSPVALVAVNPLRFNEFYASCAASQRKDDAFQAAKLIVPSDGGLRPSMETAFHAFLDTVVIHTHPVLTNAIACVEDGAYIAEILFGPRVRWVPYQAPGHDLAQAIFRESHDTPQAFLLQNHGLIVSAPTVGECVRLHERLIEQAKSYVLHGAGDIDWPHTAWEELDGYQVAHNPVLKEYAENAATAARLLNLNPIPDSFTFTDGAAIVGAIGEAKARDAKAAMLLGTGLAYRTSRKRAMEFDDILTASHFVRVLARHIGEPRYLSEADCAALRADAAETYRKQLKQ